MRQFFLERFGPAIATRPDRGRRVRTAALYLTWALWAAAGRAETALVVSVEPHERQTLDWLKRHALCDYVDVKPTATAEELAELKAAGWKVVLHMMGHPESFDRQYRVRKRQNLTVDEAVGNHLRASNGRAEDVVWQILMEEDSAGVAFPRALLREKPATHADAYALFRRRLDEALAAARPYPGVRLWGRAGFASSMHPFAAAGLEMVILERTNDDVEDLSTGLAFARGAARQHGCRWGVDFSQWWTAIAACDLENSASFFRRNFFLSYFAGAQSLGIELLGKLPAETPASATALSDAWLEFGQFQRMHRQGTPVAPVAVLLSRDHGWISPSYWHNQFRAWNYARLPYRVGDRGIDGVFATAFPGSTYAMHPYPFGAYADEPRLATYSLAHVSAAYVPSPADAYHAPPPLPFGGFGTAQEARETLLRESRESSAYRPMADSRWGDILDVVTEDASLEALARYRLVVVAGHVVVADELLRKLRRYAEQGGTLVWAVGAARPEHADFTGCRLTARLKQGRAWRWREEPAQPEAFLHVPAEPIDPRAEVLAASPAGEPLAIAVPRGQGRVVTCLLPWLESEHAPLSALATRILDQCVEPLRPVRIDGLPVQYVVSRDADRLLVCIANHAEVPWTGRVAVRDAEAPWNACVELRTAAPLPVRRRSDGAEIDAAVGRFDVAVLQWTAGAAPTSPP